MRAVRERMGPDRRELPRPGRDEDSVLLQSKFPDCLRVPAPQDIIERRGRESRRSRLPQPFLDRIATQDITLPDGTDGAVEALCIAIDSSQPERVRDAIKERLWRSRPAALTRSTLEDLLQGRHEKMAREFRLEEYGIFIPSGRGSLRRSGPIRSSIGPRSIVPRGAGRAAPAARANGGVPARSLHELPEPPVPRRRSFAASGVGRRRLGIEVPLTRVAHHDIITLAARSYGFSNVSSGHENLQKYFLEHDPHTIACEVPVWMESWEFADYPSVLKTCDPLTGHIDVLRREEDGLLGVWDYKPHAAAERDAHIQVFLYALMLSLRTGLPLSAFLCGYFDETDAYLFVRPRPSTRRTKTRPSRPRTSDNPAHGKATVRSW